MTTLVDKFPSIRTVEETEDHIIVHGHVGVFEDRDIIYPKHTFFLERDDNFYYIYSKTRHKIHYLSQYPQELKDKYESINND